MATEVSQPSLGRPSSSPSAIKRRHSPGLSLDLSDLPALSQPSPPSNTLLVTNLQDPTIFAAPNLQSIRDAINAQVPLHSFSPLKSFRRIVASFYSIEDATTIRQLLDGEAVLGCRVRVYFGEPTKLEVEDQHLQAPKSQKMFFISPPPSPPHGWEMRNEDPPNKAVHAEDLSSALAKLHARPTADYLPPSPVENRSPGGHRSRSSTIVYHPGDHGHSPALPAISVEDTTLDLDDEVSPVDGGSPVDGSSKAFIHTARPPVELME